VEKDEKTQQQQQQQQEKRAANPKLLYTRAQALENLGDLEGAARDGARAHAIDPSGAFHDALLLAHRCNVRRLGTTAGPKPRPQDFEITTVLGEGNYTRVLLAQSVWTQESFAIKTVSLAQVTKTERRHKNVRNELVMEREVLIEMRPHANVVRLYHTFKDAQSLYFLFQYVAGSVELFHILCDAGPKDKRKEMTVHSVPASAARHYAAQTVNALEHLHAHGVVHRDLKPENIMVRPDHRIFLIDFGTAKNLRDDTHNGPEFVGTPEYMSPEAINSKATGPEADLWALGCILYQMLCGQNAFVGGSQ
jgi:serine/threonine protein kinase